MTVEKQLARLIRKHGILELLEITARLCLYNAEDIGKTARNLTHPAFQDAAFDFSSFHYEAGREIRRAIGSIRQYRPTSKSVFKEKRY